MKKIAIYPFDKITRGIVRFRDLAEFEINAVIDFINFDGHDAGIETDGKEAGFKITSNIEEALDGVDTLIMNEAGAPVPVPEAIKFYDENGLQEKWMNLVKIACSKGIRVISTHELRDQTILDWIEANEDVEVEIGPSIGHDEAINLIDEMKIYQGGDKIKKIGIYGTNSCVGKFTTQMELLREMKKTEKVTAIITEPTGFLFGLPQFVNIKSYELVASEYMKAKIKESEEQGYDYVINSGQSGLSFVLNRMTRWVFFNILRLVSFMPDKAVLVCGYDDDENVQDVIDFLRLFAGVEKPSAILLADKKEKYGQLEEIPIDVIERRKIELREKFGIEHVELIKDVYKVKAALL